MKVRVMSDQREIGFTPSVIRKPRVLRPQQIHEYNETGRLYPFTALNGNSALEHAEFFNRLMAEFKANGADAYSINCKHMHFASLYDIVVNPHILAVVGDLLGEDFLAWGTHYFCKEPGDPRKVAWHQDASYWPLTPSKTLTVWLAIDDVDEENSAMQVISGTHVLGHLKWRQVHSPAVLDQELEGVESLGTPESVCLKSGQFSIHSDLTAHGSEPNRSNRRRCGLTIRYCPIDVKPLRPEWGANAIYCSGKRSEHWTYINRPVGDNVEAATSAIVPALAGAAK